MQKNRKNKSITIDQVTQQAKALLLEDGFHAPTLIVECRDHLLIGQFNILADTHEGRKAQLFVVGATLANEDDISPLEKVFMINEGWAVTKGIEDEPEVPPSEDPDHTEVLVITMYTVATGDTTGRTLEMLRREDGTIAGLVEQAPLSKIRSNLIDAFVYGWTTKGRGFEITRKN